MKIKIKQLGFDIRTNVLLKHGRMIEIITTESIYSDAVRKTKQCALTG